MSVFMLPEPDLLPDMEVNFLELVEMRASVRHYAETSLSQRELSCLLWCAQGVKMVLPNGKSVRNVPAVGGSHMLETELIVHRVEGLAAGFYRFLPFDHAVLFLGRDCLDEAALRAQFSPEDDTAVRESAVTIVWSAVRERIAGKDDEAARRCAYIESGHASQNVCLAAQAMKIGTGSIRAWPEKAVNLAYGFDGAKTFSVGAMTVGKME
ncbi:MAG: SagB/ThcOx family dehydrogenase [Mitsuokella sp.]